MSYSIKIRKRFGRIIISHFAGIVTKAMGADFRLVPDSPILRPLVTLNIDYFLMFWFILTTDTIDFILSGDTSSWLDSSRGYGGLNGISPPPKCVPTFRFFDLPISEYESIDVYFRVQWAFVSLRITIGGGASFPRWLMWLHSRVPHNVRC